jgi:hypothetical protein
MNKKIVIVGAVAGVVVIAVLISVIIKLSSTPEPPAQIGGVGTVATIENIEELQAEMKEPVQDGYYHMRMNMEWSFPSGGAASADAYVANSEQNKRTVYFTVTLDETGELVFTSPHIPVGSQLTDIALDKKLPAGVYPAVVTYHLLDDEGKELTTVSVAVKLHILS